MTKTILAALLALAIGLALPAASAHIEIRHDANLDGDCDDYDANNPDSDHQGLTGGPDRAGHNHHCLPDPSHMLVPNDLLP